MRSLNKIIIGAATAALAITALGAPVAAADTTGTLAFVNGRPGPPIDICIGPKEMSSRLGYGKVYEKDVISVGPKVVRYFIANKKRCGGRMVARQVISVTPGTDLTMVLTRRAPNLVTTFDNTYVSAPPTHNAFPGEIPPRGAPLTHAPVSISNAGDMPANLLLKGYLPLPEEEVPAPAAFKVWGKGEHLASYVAAGDLFLVVRATLPGSPATIARRGAYIKASRRYEWILVGTNRLNARMVLIDRGVSAATP